MPRDDDPSRDDTLAAPATLRGVGAGPTETAGTPSETLDRPSLPDYELGSRIGQGGMGEVLLGHDKTIGRDIAIKRLRRGVDSPQAVGRFLREARIQARLEHPSIVPVHTLGRDRSGDPFFTMKLLVGMTLADSLAAATPPTLQELLRNLVDVCRAIELAHARGVVHRDLKPENIMLGNFGEVYVLDWGVARIVDDREAVGAAGDVTTLDGLTEAGALFGTPGYMAPEQVEGSASIGPAADIYALGAILFEILTHEPLHPRGKRALVSTLGDLDPSAARRRPDLAIPPELDKLCAAALEREPEQRPTIRALADALQRYLDGDRDHERRRQLAMEELTSARATLASGDVTRRADAIRSAGRALALDPASREAATLITQLMLEPPKQHPPSLAATLSASDSAVQRRQGRAAALSLGVVLIFLGWAALNGARDAWLLVTLASSSALLAVLAWSASRRAASVKKMWLIAIGNAVLAALISRLFGSLIVTPVVACVMAVSLTSYPQLMQHARIVIAMLIAAWLGPVALEYAGVLAPTWRVDDGSVVSMSSAIQIGGAATSALLIGANVLAIAVIGLFANALARSRHAAQRDVEIQAWHLRQLLPDS